MPTYEFACPEGHDFEKFYRTISAAPSEVECPVCGRLATRKVSGGAGLLFKGSGFYITDYGKDGKKDQKSAPSSASATKSDASKSDASKSDSGTTKSESSTSPSSSSAPSTSPTKSSE